MEIGTINIIRGYYIYNKKLIYKYNIFFYISIMESINKMESMKKMMEDYQEDSQEEEYDEEEDYEEEEEEEDELYLQKFKYELNNNYLIDVHPECIKHNDEEIKLLSKVVRDEHNIIIDDLHKTIPYLTKYEKARVIGVRAKQINMGAQIFIDVDPTIIDGAIIAEKELLQRKMPFIIRRPLPGGGSEYWNLSDLEII
jgi:DNA-directed RNA polymerase I, II, and III subunit RPABC2